MSKSSNSKKSAASKGSKKKATADAPAKKKKASPVTYLEDEATGQKIILQKATMKDLKNKASISGKNKKLFIISSESVRHECYQQAAMAIAQLEQDLLPSYGGRSWEVSCSVNERTNIPHAGRVLFRSYGGQMELAVLPHLLEKIPEPPKWAGRKLSDIGAEYVEQEGEYEISKLQNREISVLSQVAWDWRQYGYPVPSVSMKWKSPDYRTFSSRKQAWDHAQVLAKQDGFIDKHLLGYGARGMLLQPANPTLSTIIKVGQARFERDGLWVIGQEMQWQEGRPALMEQQAKERQNAPPPTDRHWTACSLYVYEQREAYKNEHDEISTLRDAEIALRKLFKELTADEKKEWTKKAKKLNGNDEEEEQPVLVKDENGDIIETKGEGLVPMPGPERQFRPMTYFLYCRRHSHRQERQAELNESMTLEKSEKELRKLWKDFSKEMKDEWKLKLEEFKEKSILHVVPVANMPEAVKSQSELLKVKESSSEQPHKLEEEGKNSVVMDVETFEKPTAAANQLQVHSSKVMEVEDLRTVVEASKTPGVVADKTNEKIHLNDVKCPQKSAEKVTSDEGSLGSKTSSEGTESKTETVEKPLPDPMPSASSVPKPVKPKAKSPEKKKNTSLSLASKAKPPLSLVSKSDRWCLKPDQVSLCYDACLDHFDKVMRTVKTRDLQRELENGFDVFRERGRGRYDMELPVFETPQFDFLNSLDKAPWMQVVRAILGDDVVLIHKGSFISMPGAETQVYHQDGVHLTTQTQRPCHAINVFVPLVDLTMRNGPTEFTLGSHVLGHEDYDRDFLETPTPKAGVPLIFDYRLGHRGLGNSSQQCRPIVYCTYARATEGKDFRDSVNFSRKRYHKLGDLIEKPLSRAERTNKRRRSMEEREEEEQLKQTLEESKKAKTAEKQQEAGSGSGPKEGP